MKAGRNAPQKARKSATGREEGSSDRMISSERGETASVTPQKLIYEKTSPREQTWVAYALVDRQSHQRWSQRARQPTCAPSDACRLRCCIPGAAFERPFVHARPKTPDQFNFLVAGNTVNKAHVHTKIAYVLSKLACKAHQDYHSELLAVHAIRQYLRNCVTIFLWLLREAEEASCGCLAVHSLLCPKAAFSAAAATAFYFVAAGADSVAATSFVATAIVAVAEAAASLAAAAASASYPFNVAAVPLATDTALKQPQVTRSLPQGSLSFQPLRSSRAALLDPARRVPAAHSRPSPIGAQPRSVSSDRKWHPESRRTRSTSV
eukprot:1082405-Pleurochrysis_carterae.AAC.3